MKRILLSVSLLLVMTSTASAQHKPQHNTFNQFNYRPTLNGYGWRPGYRYYPQTGWNEIRYGTSNFRYKNGYDFGNSYYYGGNNYNGFYGVAGSYYGVQGYYGF
jgi:hypothetical protein